MKNKILNLFEKNELNIEIAGMKLKVVDATKNIGQQLTDLQERVAKMETLRGEGGQEGVIGVDKEMNELKERVSILWVDDYPSNNAFLIEKLRKDGISVKLSLDTEDALNNLMNQKFEAVITDLGRREGGRSNAWAGLHLVQKIRSSDDITPVLVFAGARGVENSEKLIRAGASGVTQDAVDVLNFVANVKASKSL